MIITGKDKVTDPSIRAAFELQLLVSYKSAAAAAAENQSKQPQPEKGSSNEKLIQNQTQNDTE